MDSVKVDKWVAKPLELVPKGDHCQSKFRMGLNFSFRNALGSNPENPGWDVRQTVAEVIETIGCKPKYDPALLRLSWPSDAGAES